MSIKAPLIHHPRAKFHRCDCGNISAFKKQNDWVCERCSRLENDYDRAPRREVENPRPSAAFFYLEEYPVHLPFQGNSAF